MKNIVLTGFMKSGKTTVGKEIAKKLNLMFSHINSTPRENLGNKTPYEIFTFIYGEELANKLNIQKIEKDEVCTTPRLLK